MKLYVKFLVATAACLGFAENRCATADPKIPALQAYDDAEVAFLAAAGNFVKASDKLALKNDLAKKFKEVGTTLETYYTLSKDADIKTGITETCDVLKKELNKDNLTNLRALKYFMTKNIIALIDQGKATDELPGYIIDKTVGFNEYLENFKPEYADLQTLPIIFGPTPGGLSAREKFDKVRADYELNQLATTKKLGLTLPAMPNKLNEVILAYVKAFDTLKTDPGNAAYKRELTEKNFNLADLFKVAAELTVAGWDKRAWNKGTLKTAEEKVAEQKKTFASDPEPAKTIKNLLVDMQLAIAKALTAAPGKKINLENITNEYKGKLSAELRKMVGAFPAKKTATSSTTAIDNFASALKQLVGEKKGEEKKPETKPEEKKKPVKFYEPITKVFMAGAKLYEAQRTGYSEKVENNFKAALSALKSDTKALSAIQTYPSAMAQQLEAEVSPNTETLFYYELGAIILSLVSLYDADIITTAEAEKLSNAYDAKVQKIAAAQNKNPSTIKNAVEQNVARGLKEKASDYILGWAEYFGLAG